MPKDIDKMTLKEIEAEIEGMGWEVISCNLVIRQKDTGLCKHNVADSHEDAARAALMRLREREK